MKEIIIFCQAAGDIQQVLSIYDKYNEKTSISIFCINVKSTHIFLSSISLNVKRLIFIPYSRNFALNNPKLVIEERKRLVSLYKHYFINIENSNIYLFSLFYDWVTFSFIARLYNNNDIYLIDNYGYLPMYIPIPTKRLSIKLKLSLFIYKVITGSNLQLIENGNDYIIALPPNKYKVRNHPVNKDLFYLMNKYQLNLNIAKDSILFFDIGNVLDRKNIYRDYQLKVLELINIVKKNNMELYIKPHPRNGISSFLNGMSNIIPTHIPAEYLPIQKFSLILGLNTVTIANLAKYYDNVFSIIDYFDCMYSDIKKKMKLHLLEQSENKVIFIKHPKQLIKHYRINKSTC